MATPFRSGKAGRIRSSDIRIKKYFGFSQRIASRFFGDPPLTASQTDDFNDNSLDTAKWQNNSGARITETNQRIEITTLTTAGYYSLETKEWQSLYNSSVSVKVTNAGNQALTSLEMYPMEIVSPNSQNAVGFFITGNSVYMYKYIFGTISYVAANFAYSSVTHLYFRIRELDGNTYWDTSADGTSWTNRAMVQNPFSYSRVKPILITGTYAAEATTTTVWYEDYNITSSGTLFSQSCPETITLVDTTFRTSSRRLTETLPLVDVISKSPSRILTDAITLVDTARRTTTRSLLEAITLVDTFAGKITARLLSDSLALADTISKSTSRTISEIITLTDNLARTTTRAFIEAISLSDTFAGAKITVKNLLETLTLTDTISKITTRTLSETLILADTIRRTTQRILTEALSMTDFMTKASGRTLTEAVSLADSIAKATTRRLTEAVSLADTIIRTTTRQLLEALSLTDSFSFNRSISRLYSETLTLTDSIAKTTSKIARETITLVDTFLGEIIVLVIKSIGNWILYALTGLNKIVRLEGKAHTISTTKAEHVVLLSQRSFTVSATETSNVLRSNKTP